MIRADAIVVLGCVVERTGRPSRTLARRIALAARAYHAGTAPRVLACGGQSWHGHVEARVMARELAHAGVPHSAIAVELSSLTTAENARHALLWLRAQEAARVMVATSAWHLPRALANFRRLGVDAVAPPAEWLVNPPPSLWLRVRERTSTWLDARALERKRDRTRVVLGAIVCAGAIGCGGGSGTEGAANTSAADGALGANAAESTSAGDAPAASSAANTDDASASSSPEARVAALLAAELDRRADLVRPEDAANRDVRVRRAAARALARIANAAARAGLVRALGDEDDEVVAWAAYGLGFSCETEREKTVGVLAAAAAARLAAGAGPTGAPTKNRGRLDATRAIVRAVGGCAAEASETVLDEWTRDPRIAVDAVYALGDVATARKKLREDSYVTLLNLAAGDAAHEPLADALYPFGRVKLLPPSVIARTLEVGKARLANAGPERVFAVRALARTDESAVPQLEEVVLGAERFTALEREEAARGLARFGRDGQRALARLLNALAPKTLAAEDSGSLVDTTFGVLLTLLDGVGEIGDGRATLGALARLEAPKDANAALLRRVSWLRCGAAKILAERNYTDEALQKCDLSGAGGEPGFIGAKHVVDAIGITGADIRGARLSAWRRYALEGPLVAREAAIALISEHAELEDVSEVLIAALRAKEPGLQASAAEVIAKQPQRARLAPKRKKKDPPPRSDAPVHPDIAAALGERLASPGADLEALGAVIDAAGALRLEALRPAIRDHCVSAFPSLREHAQKALAALSPSVEPAACDHAAAAAPALPEREHLLTAPVHIHFASDVGELELELDPSLAPVAATRLADLARSGFFRGIVVHRVVPGFVSQLGTPTADGYGGADLPPLRCETSPIGFAPGSVGIALAGRDTGGSQFFVTHAAYPHLDGHYAWVGTAKGPWSALVEGDVIGDARVE